MIMSVTWRICAISAALSRRVMMMAGRKVLPMVEKKDEKKDVPKDEKKDAKKVVPKVVPKDEKKDAKKVVPKVVPKEPKMRRRPQPIAFLQWACLPSKWQQQPSCH